MMASVVRTGVRTILAGQRRVRHAWLAVKPAKRISRAAQQSFKAGNRALDRFARFSSAARQLAWYDVPGEQRVCPACQSPRIRNLQVLGYTRPLAEGRRYGFISGCSRCGVVFANPLPPPALLDSTYTPEGKWGQTRPDHEPPVSRSRMALLFKSIERELDVLSPPAGAAVLDFGCGLGGMLDALQERGWETYGIDPGTKAAFARHKELTAVPGAPAFDLTILHHVLEHVIDPAPILQQLARATRPGGFLLVSVPNLDRVHEHRDLPYCIRSNTHVLAYSRACLTFLLAAVGFRALEAAAASDDPAAVRRQVVLARRETGTLPSPSDPLASAESALDAYYARAENSSHRSRLIPVRVRAAVANLARGARAHT